MPFILKSNIYNAYIIYYQYLLHRLGCFPVDFCNGQIFEPGRDSYETKQNGFGFAQDARDN